MDLKKVKIRKAVSTDVKGIKEIIDYFSQKDLMLPRSLSSIYENIRDYHVAEAGGKIVGCVALHVVWEDLAEIRSLAVLEEWRNQKIGSKLVRSAIREAKKMGVNRIFTLTYIPDFFKQFGFRKIRKNKLPQKIWKDCLSCTHFPDCSEEALILEIAREG